jgi:hypothetical protein
MAGIPTGVLLETILIGENFNMCAKNSEDNTKH